MKFEEKLIKLRKQKILSQEELAEKLNVTRQTISKWELGQTKPDIDKIKEISELFEVSVEELISETTDIQVENAQQVKAKKERKYLIYILVLVLIAAIITLIIRVNIQKEQEKEEGKSTGIFSIFDGFFDTFNEASQSMQSQYQQNVEQMNQEHQDRVNKHQDEYEKNVHNMYFESRTGTKATIFVESILDEINKINKKNTGHNVTLVYNNITTTDETEIKNLKHSLEEWGEYEVSIEYDENGYVNKVILEDIN